ncbi:MAG: hypothetical protein ACLP1X_18585 [Polyangiaceae bacterium]
MRSFWAFGIAVPLAWVAACSSSSSGFGPSGDDSTENNVDGGGLQLGTDFDGNGPIITLGDSSVAATNAGPCKGGFYEGQFGGLYSSSLTGFGINIPVVGDVQLTLQQQGSGQQTCMLEGEATKCSDVFSVKNGTITGTADGLFPYFCTLTGTLGCAEKKLVGGWINCTYCIGSLNDGGMSCANGGSGNGNSGGGVTGTGGQFAGPLTADYFYTSTGGDGGAGAIDGGGSGPPAFGTVPPPLGANASDYDPGAWNGAESLAGYKGTGPLPEGGTLGNYISDAGYGMIGVPNDFGGDGWWYATYQHP